jgi:hypothetical protein
MPITVVILPPTRDSPTRTCELDRKEYEPVRKVQCIVLVFVGALGRHKKTIVAAPFFVEFVCAESGALIAGSVCVVEASFPTW